MQAVTAERRAAMRFHVGLPVLVDGAESTLLQLSPRGLLLQARTPPTVGKAVQLEMRCEADDGRPDVVRVTGNVLRAEMHAGEFLLAVHLNEALY